MYPLGDNYLPSKQKLSTLYSVIITLLPTRIFILLVENNIRVRLSILTVETRYSIRLLYLSLCPGSWLSTLIIFFPSPLYVGRGPWLLYIFRFIIAKQERPYQHDSTASRLLSEVKHARAQLVLRWGTTLESWVLFSFRDFFFGPLDSRSLCYRATRTLNI